MASFFKLSGKAICLAAILIQSLQGSAQAQDRQFRFQLSASSDPYPTIRGLTDLPDGTKVMVTLLKPHLPDGQQRMARGLPACEDMCGPAEVRQKPYVDPVVRNGSFIAGPFSFGDHPLKPDTYPIRITIVPEKITEASLDAMNHPVYFGEIRIPGDGDREQPPKKRENWQSINLPPNLDGKMYAYDKNSIALTRDARGAISGAEMLVRVIRGDESILGKQVLFSFLCDGSRLFRINHSSPISFQSRLPTQEGQLANLACAAARCEISRQQNNGSSLCSRTDNR
ncbi:hypothetical protein [Bradyrhizobium sp. dw_411]|uniref:hypothetical protein n=1 Tax=Bradyrhizobium sp. dw_411 TaxID=2720082 RepID=UPI001BCF0B5E|nr:hypothetical protein [Bradyrhizobium sp. dw_411]